MPSSPDFVAFALDLLAPLGAVQARAMFGGHGLYARGVMFGLLDDDELFLKTDEVCRPRFVDAGCRRWVYGGMESTSYFRPPDAAHDDPEAMEPWARLALDAALRAQAEKARRAAAKMRSPGAKAAKAQGSRAKGKRAAISSPSRKAAPGGAARRAAAPRAGKRGRARRAR